MNYKVIKQEELKKINQYNWFKQFSNPCYGFNVKMNVTNVVKYSKDTGTSFFINTLYLITNALNQIEEMRIRIVNQEIRLYDEINPAFTIMTKAQIFENTGFEMISSYDKFYSKAKEVIESVKNQSSVKKTYNDSKLFNEYYITCIPWISIEGMTHPLIDNDYESLTVPRICWDKYREENGGFFMTLNITVNHMFVDGYPLSEAFKKVQEYFDKLIDIK